LILSVLIIECDREADFRGPLLQLSQTLDILLRFFMRLGLYFLSYRDIIRRWKKYTRFTLYCQGVAFSL